MPTKKIVVTVNKDGEVSIDAQHFKGAECEAATKSIEKALGTTTERTRKRSYHEKPLRASQQQKG